ncbi:amidohydrolase family protein [Isosphaeraceae bacterium EP7]
MADRISRRDALRHTAALALAASAPAIRTAKASTIGLKEPMIPIVDTHQHLWDTTKFTLPWLKPGEPLSRSYLMADYLAATAGQNVVKTIYMEVDLRVDQQAAEADYVIGLCRAGDNPMVGAVISGRPSSDGFKAYIGKYKDTPEVKGLRQVLHGEETPPGYCLSPAFIAGIRHLGELGKSYDICIRPAELADAARLVDACPGTSFILDHCGNADVRSKDRSAWKSGIDALAKKPNLVCKVSGIVASAKGFPWTADDLAPIVDHVLDAFGPDRVIFGGDWPVCTLAATYIEWLDALKEIIADRSESDRRKLFHDNALRIYHLS